MSSVVEYVQTTLYKYITCTVLVLYVFNMSIYWQSTGTGTWAPLLSSDDQTTGTGTRTVLHWVQNEYIQQGISSGNQYLVGQV